MKIKLELEVELPDENFDDKDLDEFLRMTYLGEELNYDNPIFKSFQVKQLVDTFFWHKK